MAYNPGLAFDTFSSYRAGPSSARTTQDLAASIAGFGPLTRIETDFGPMPAQALRVRDRVLLRNGRFLPIARIDMVLLDEAFLERHPEAQPVLIGAGGLSNGLPAEAVLVAPGQKLSPRQGLHGTCALARDLVQTRNAQSRPELTVTYVVISFLEPEDVCVDGLWLRVEPPLAQLDDDEE